MRFTVAASLAVVGLGASCLENESSVFIQGQLPINAEEECVVDAGDEVFLSNGRLDVLSPRSFTAALKVVTNLPATFNNIDVTQGRQQSPNYPAYGGVDNNVIIFNAAETTFQFRVPQDVADAADPDLFECDDTGFCNTNEDRPTVTSASAAVFNTQTQLNTEAVVFVEAITADFAQSLKDNLAGALDLPGKQVRVVANVTLVGTTTGNGELRELRTFPFPLQIDVCQGCLNPDAAFCTDNDAVLDPIEDVDTCFVGQDVTLAVCRCADGNLLDTVACP